MKGFGKAVHVELRLFQTSDCSTVVQANLCFLTRVSPLRDLWVGGKAKEPPPPRLNQTPRSRLSPIGRSGPAATRH